MWLPRVVLYLWFDKLCVFSLYIQSTCDTWTPPEELSCFASGVNKWNAGLIAVYLYYGLFCLLCNFDSSVPDIETFRLCIDYDGFCSSWYVTPAVSVPQMFRSFYIFSPLHIYVYSNCVLVSPLWGFRQSSCGSYCFANVYLACESICLHLVLVLLEEWRQKTDN